MASVSRLSKRKDASRWPRMSSTFWAVVLLTALLVLYCGKSPTLVSGRTYRRLEALETDAGAQRVSVSCGNAVAANYATGIGNRSKCIDLIVELSFFPF